MCVCVCVCVCFVLFVFVFCLCVFVHFVSFGLCMQVGGHGLSGWLNFIFSPKRIWCLKGKNMALIRVGLVCLYVCVFVCMYWFVYMGGGSWIIWLAELYSHPGKNLGFERQKYGTDQSWSHKPAQPPKECLAQCQRPIVRWFIAMH